VSEHTYYDKDKDKNEKMKEEKDYNNDDVANFALHLYYVCVPYMNPQGRKTNQVQFRSPQITQTLMHET
jgi:hypothetical protein